MASELVIQLCARVLHSAFRRMTAVHVVIGVRVLVLNLVAGVWGGVSWLRREPSVGFWYVAPRRPRSPVVVQILLG